MEFALRIALIVAMTAVVITYPRKDIFIDRFKIKGSYKYFELEICAKQKNGSPSKNDRSNHKK